jgi:hypothetical protein
VPPQSGGREKKMNTPNKKYKDSLFVAYMTDDPGRLIEIYNAILDMDIPKDANV